MEIELKKYDLPDAGLIRGMGPQRRFLVWRPDFTCIVLGAGDKISSSIHAENVKRDNIPVYKRPSGGEAVLLSPNTLVISVAVPGEKLFTAKKYFNKFNPKIIGVLEALGVKNLNQNGISDIAINNQKILGSAIYQNKDRVLYHAILNVRESGSLIEKYLKHPQREPEYRAGRKHRDFVTSLLAKNYHFDMAEIRRVMNLSLH